MRDEQQVHGLCIRALIERQLPAGGWPFTPEAKQMAIEPTALALLALPLDLKHEREAAIRALVLAQNANGSWPAVYGDDSHGSGYTGLVAYALSRCRGQEMPTRRALHWLLKFRGSESHWLWKWKFRTIDRHVRFDPDKFGWPWVPGTVSWVIPSAYSLMALKQARGNSRQRLLQSRIRRGVEMLYDRMCPEGGWNAGNSVVYGSRLIPHPDATAIALFALMGESASDSITVSLDWLEQCAQTLFAPWSLAWTILALQAYMRPTQSSVGRLCAVMANAEIRDGATLAVACLALGRANSPELLVARP